MDSRILKSLLDNLKPIAIEPSKEEVSKNLSLSQSHEEPAEAISVLPQSQGPKKQKNRGSTEANLPPPEPSLSLSLLTILDLSADERKNLIQSRGSRAYQKDSKKRASSVLCGAMLDAKIE